MAVIAENVPVAEGIFTMLLYEAQPAQPGQFVMVRTGSGADPLLPRPLCVFDCEPERRSIRLLYQVKGRGTALLSRMRAGDALTVGGPYGNGFPLPEGNATLVGGGLGIAPLLLLAKSLRARQPERRVDIYLGYSGQPFCEDLFTPYADTLEAQAGGFITERVDFKRPGTYFACGPTPMLRAAHKLAQEAGAPLYVSLEKRMGCGVGACYACSIKTTRGNRRVCKDGPVFLAEEVFCDA